MTNYRTVVVCIGILSLFFLLILKLFFIQIIKGPSYQRRARSQYERRIEIEAKRGIIYDRNFTPLALNIDVTSFYAVPPHRQVVKEKIASVFADVTGQSKEKILEKLQKKSSFVWLARKIDNERSEKIKKCAIDSVYSITESKRFYPKGSLGAHIVGFANIDNQGLEGIELTFNDVLSGVPGWSILELDAKGNYYPSFDLPHKDPKDGKSLVLTIDATVQGIVEEELHQAVEKYNAKGGMAIVMNVKTGEILAMANEPHYNPNYVSDYKMKEFRNKAVTDQYEPGSSFKFVTASVALNEGIMKIDDPIYAEEGRYKIVENEEIKDVNPYGWLTFSQVFEKSSNIGTVKIAEACGLKRMYSYIRAFGFGCETYISLPGEAKGNLRHPREWSLRSLATISIGQEISVTALQMITAFSAIANKGTLLEPYIVKSIVDRDKNIIKTREPTFVRQVISPTTSRFVLDILTGVVEQGTGTEAKINGYKIAGKTGTAQKRTPQGTGYAEGKFVASFVATIPADEPILSAIVVIDEPSGIYWGGKTAAPTFKNIMERIINTTNYLPQKQRLVIDEENNTDESLTNTDRYSLAEKGIVKNASLSYSTQSGWVYDLKSEVPGEDLDSPTEAPPRGSSKHIASTDELTITLPNVKGMTMRQVAVCLSSNKISFNFIGNGIAVKQTPPPGTKLRKGDICIVEFEEKK